MSELTSIPRDFNCYAIHSMRKPCFFHLYNEEYNSLLFHGVASGFREDNLGEGAI